MFDIRAGDKVDFHGRRARVLVDIDESTVTLDDPKVPGPVLKTELRLIHRDWVSSAITGWFNQPTAERQKRINETLSVYSAQWRKGFNETMQQNLHVFDAALREIIRLKQRGFTHYSMRAIIAYLRHHTAVTTGGEWKINNNITPDLARLMMLVFPELEGFFSLRTNEDRRLHG